MINPETKQNLNPGSRAKVPKRLVIFMLEKTATRDNRTLYPVDATGDCRSPLLFRTHLRRSRAELAPPKAVGPPPDTIPR